MLVAENLPYRIPRNKRQCIDGKCQEFGTHRTNTVTIPYSMEQYMYSLPKIYTRIIDYCKLLHLK